MKLFIRISIALCLIFTSISHAGTTIPKFSIKNEGKKIAIVSLSANNWANSLDRINTKEGDELIESQLNIMLEIALNKFQEKNLKVIPMKDFINKKEFQLLAGEPLEVGVPAVDGTILPLMAENRKQLVKCQLDEKKAIELTKVTGADFVAVMYSEWAVKTGRFVPTSKALAKNVIGIYNASGKQVYFGRSDKLGNATLGAMGTVAVNEGTIRQWVLAYEKGLDALFSGRR
ncbi:MAG: hypothetical protein ACNYPE_03435 [Candidatus Azotimanducaceae bacterium WSBS_2022_MAG_OTU7]